MSAGASLGSANSAQGLLDTKAVDKVWGRSSLPEPFASEARGKHKDGEPVGEIWFASPPQLDGILVKYLFTSQKLSVQVHPSDAQAQEGEAGKEECWLILDAEPGASLAIGFRENLTPEAMRAAALDGSIENLLEWHEVSAGDFFYLPAGTVHAIGSGISLLEVQQSSDTTFRLYDYGRPRELHLDRAMAVAEGRAYDAVHRCKVSDATSHLVEGPHFQLTRLVGAPDVAVLARYSQPVMVLPLAGHVSLDGEVVPAGSCGHAADLAAFRFSDDAVAMLVADAT